LASAAEFDADDVTVISWSDPGLGAACNGHGWNFRPVHKAVHTSRQEAEI